MPEGNVEIVIQVYAKWKEDETQCKHVWSEWKVGQKPTCTAKGNEARYCKKCNKTEMQYIDALGHNYKDGVCINEGCGAKEPADETYTIDGDYVYFGSYPQTKVSDEKTVSSLNEKAGKLPTSSDFNGWTSYEYYIKGDNSAAFMWYKDLSYGGEKYRGVYSIKYRSSWCSSHGGTDGYQKENGYELSTCYWFKYEPLKWRILTKENGKAFLLCDIAIDSGHYSYDKNKDIGNNDYTESDIRAWLNDNFYNATFNKTQKTLIQSTSIDNSARSTNTHDNATRWNDGINDFACENTNDKIFLLSNQEITNPDYGFKSNPDEADSARQFKSTDYAKSQGCYRHKRSTADEGDYTGNCHYWLRSPSCGGSRFASYIAYDGKLQTKSYTEVAASGIIPALWLDLGEAEEPVKYSEGLEFTLNSDGESYSVTGIGTCKDTNLIIPAIYNEKPVIAIGAQAFYKCGSITSVIIPDSVTSINSESFRSCRELTSIIIPHSVRHIGFCAFVECLGLTSVTIPNSVTSISVGPFAGCDNLESIVVEEGNVKYHSKNNCLIETESKALVSGCKNSIIPGDGSVTSIRYSAFEGILHLTNINIPNTVKAIGPFAFRGCEGLIV